MSKQKSKEFIICLVVLPVAALLAVVPVLWFSSSKEPDNFPLSENYIPLSHYSLTEAETDELLGKCELTGSDTMDNVYSVKGLPEDYVLRKHGNMMPGGISEELYMKNTAMEPIMRYGVSEIVIHPFGSVKLEEKLVISDNEILKELLAVRRNQNGTKCEEPSSINTQIKLNAKYEMIFSCNIVTDEQGQIILECFDAAKNGWYRFDVTQSLRDAMG